MCLRLSVFVAGVVMASSALSDQANVENLNDFTQPTFGPAVDENDDYVDEAVARRQNCLSHPGRPGWMMVHARGFEWRMGIAQQWRGRHVGRRMKESGVCTCDILYPDWNMFRPDVEALWASVSDQSRYEWDKRTEEKFRAVFDPLAHEARGYSFMIGKLCRNPE